MTRGSLYVSAGVLVLAGIACFFAASVEWGYSLELVDPISGEASEQAGFVLEMAAVGALNLVAALILVLLRSRITWWAIVALQAALFLAALAQGVRTDPPGWFAFSSLPLATLSLLIVVPFAAAKLKASAIRPVS
jgi:hypothetical protein